METPLDSFLHVVDTLFPAESEGLKQKLQSRFESPPTALVAQALNLESLTDAEVRQLLFAPSSYHMGLYPQLLQGDTQCPTDLDIPSNKLQALILGHLYLVNGRCWAHVKPFIEAGGLRQLAVLLSHPNRHIGAQALQLLVMATHPGMYDWNPCPEQQQQQQQQQQTQSGGKAAEQPTNNQAVNRVDSGSPSSSNGSNTATHNSTGHSSAQQPPVCAASSKHPHSTATAAVHPSTGPDAVVWRELLQLQSGPLVGSLMRLSPDVWPGSGSMAVQLLVFYLNWLRRWWSKDGKLQLSTGLLSGLSAWSTRATASPEEQQLAAELLQDFGQYGPAPLKPGGDEGQASVDCSSEPEPECRVVADKTMVNVRPGSEAERLKAAGNDAFKAKDWSTAIRLYSAALDVPVPQEALVDEGPRRATYHANRAAAYLERYKELAAASDSSSSSSKHSNSSAEAAAGSSTRWREVGGVLDGLLLDGSSQEARAQLLQAAVMDCKAALDLVPTHTKAHYRLATALKAQGFLKAAQAAASSAQQHASGQADHAAATRLEASIAVLLEAGHAQQQQQKQHDTHTVPQDGGTSKALSDVQNSNASSSSGSNTSSTLRDTPSSAAQSLPQKQWQSGLQQSQPNACGACGPKGEDQAVEQLLQQFAAAVGQQVASQQRSAADRKQHPGAGQQAVVLLPSTAGQLLQDQQLETDQLVLPSHHSQRKQTGKRLIQELPNPDAPAAEPSEPTIGCPRSDRLPMDAKAQNILPAQQQQQSLSLAELVDGLD